jgi:hypothetical protein
MGSSTRDRADWLLARTRAALAASPCAPLDADSLAHAHAFARLLSADTPLAADLLQRWSEGRLLRLPISAADTAGAHCEYSEHTIDITHTWNSALGMLTCPSYTRKLVSRLCTDALCNRPDTRANAADALVELAANAAYVGRLREAERVLAVAVHLLPLPPPTPGTTTTPDATSNAATGTTAAAAAAAAAATRTPSAPAGAAGDADMRDTVALALHTHGCILLEHGLPRAAYAQLVDAAGMWRSAASLRASAPDTAALDTTSLAIAATLRPQHFVSCNGGRPLDELPDARLRADVHALEHEHQQQQHQHHQQQQQQQLDAARTECDAAAVDIASLRYAAAIARYAAAHRILLGIADTACSPRARADADTALVDARVGSARALLALGRPRAALAHLADLADPHAAASDAAAGALAVAADALLLVGSHDAALVSAQRAVALRIARFDADGRAAAQHAAAATGIPHDTVATASLASRSAHCNLGAALMCLSRVLAALGRSLDACNLAQLAHGFLTRPSRFITSDDTTRTGTSSMAAADILLARTLVAAGRARYATDLCCTALVSLHSQYDVKTYSTRDSDLHASPADIACVPAQLVLAEALAADDQHDAARNLLVRAHATLLACANDCRSYRCGSRCSHAPLSPVAAAHAVALQPHAAVAQARLAILHFRGSRNQHALADAVALLKPVAADTAGDVNAAAASRTTDDNAVVDQHQHADDDGDGDGDVRDTRLAATAWHAYAHMLDGLYADAAALYAACFARASDAQRVALLVAAGDAELLASQAPAPAPAPSLEHEHERVLATPRPTPRPTTQPTVAPPRPRPPSRAACTPPPRRAASALPQLAQPTQSQPSPTPRTQPPSAHASTTTPPAPCCVASSPAATLSTPSSTPASPPARGATLAPARSLLETPPPLPPPRRSPTSARSTRRSRRRSAHAATTRARARARACACACPSTATSCAACRPCCRPSAPQ